MIITDKKEKKSKFSIKAVLYILMACAVMVDIVYLYINYGHARIKEKAHTVEPIIQQTEAVTSEESVKWQEGWIKYNGGIYAYKDDIMTFLIIGTDQMASESEANSDINVGNADFLSLLVLDPETKRIEVIPINRNTMSTVATYDENGNRSTTETAQIATQYGFGSCSQDSCEYQQKAISDIFYQLPIHGYIAMDMRGIIPLNDAVGGVDITASEDYSSDEITVDKGDNIHLEGEDAYWFVRSRDDDMGGADRRLSRQEIYVNALVSKLYNSIRNNSMDLLSIYDAIDEYTVTDISNNELLYLATEAAGYTYDENSIHEISGETVKGENSDEFYIDDDALRKLVIDIFYKQVG